MPSVGPIWTYLFLLLVLAIVVGVIFGVRRLIRTKKG
jgi:flagellar biogenesis protein FliO